MEPPTDYDRQVSRNTVKSTESRARRMSKSVMHSVSGFLGLEESDKHAMRWENRRKRYAGSIGKLKDEYNRPKEGLDELDGSRFIRDPLRKPSGHVSQSSDFGTMRKCHRKSSVAHMAVKGLGNLVGARNKVRRNTHKGSQGGESAAPSMHAEDQEFNLVDDVFYDDQSKGPNLARLQATESSVGSEDKRVIGVGIVGRFFRPSIHSAAFTKDVKEQLDDMDDHRPYFTYWATFVQLVVFIVAMAVYGAAPWGIGKSTESKLVRLSNLAREVKSYTEQENIWFGPRQMDLIHLGAKYSPCMRVDINLKYSLELDRAEEKESACCVRNDGSGCVQRVASQCGSLSTWKKWELGNEGPGGRLSGSVCGQDPTYCIKPASAEPFEWADSIVDWPPCTDTRTPNNSVGSKLDRHMSCELLGRPCCYGIQGECMITTREHCDLVRGKFHEEKYLCSQTSCFEQICGMIPFGNKEKPDQFYRLWTSLFLHGGLVHLLVTIVFQMWIMRDTEKLIGAIRMAIIYIGSGVAGNLASCTFLPYQVEAGPSGAQFGVLACLLVEVLQSYQMYRRPHIAILKLAMPILVLFLFGLLPWFDNWAHLFGFIFGFLLAFAVMPYVSFGHFDRRRKIISIVVSLGSAIALFVILTLIFYIAPLTDCEACQYFNCIPLTKDFCENMQVNLKKNSTYSKVY
ncbi:inactive rhomboid protein 1-like isoform X2 [Littorina saxatilis]|uniref:Peptidase S54 rhomboid domain-containing protein n=1 Tax=Littorina saxatilis TaxID=31220 RepID=A0AAN9BW77_9CAEN